MPSQRRPRRTLPTRSGGHFVSTRPRTSRRRQSALGDPRAGSGQPWSGPDGRHDPTAPRRRHSCPSDYARPSARAGRLSLSRTWPIPKDGCDTITRYRPGPPSGTGSRSGRSLSPVRGLAMTLPGFGTSARAAKFASWPFRPGSSCTLITAAVEPGDSLSRLRRQTAQHRLRRRAQGPRRDPTL